MRSTLAARLGPEPMTQVRLARLEAFVLRAPVETPVETSFGVMRERPAVLIRAEDHDGAVGWGESWCNFPSVGAEHRARLVGGYLAPLLVGRAFASARDAFAEATERTAVLALQSGEPGPFAQAIAGVDAALWDLAARRAGEPLFRFLGGRSGEIKVYASGLNPTGPERTARRAHEAGHRAFKLKVGFGQERDVRNLAAVRDAVGADAHLALDANQAWALADAKAIAPTLEPHRIAWLEEPLRADRPWREWKELARTTRIPLAAGENLASREAFAAALAEGVLGVVQPDMAKWGGFTECLPLARRIRESGATFCPHFLGAGIGLAASAHLLAAAGGDGLLEMDVNENPLREGLTDPMPAIEAGRIRLSERPGLGTAPDMAALARWRVA